MGIKAHYWFERRSNVQCEHTCGQIKALQQEEKVHAFSANKASKMRVEHCDASGGPTEMRSKHLVFVEPDFAGFLFYLPAFLQLDSKGKKK